MPKRSAGSSGGSKTSKKPKAAKPEKVSWTDCDTRHLGRQAACRLRNRRHCADAPASTYFCRLPGSQWRTGGHFSGGSAKIQAEEYRQSRAGSDAGAPRPPQCRIALTSSLVSIARAGHALARRALGFQGLAHVSLGKPGTGPPARPIGGANSASLHCFVRYPTTAPARMASMPAGAPVDADIPAGLSDSRFWAVASG